MKRLVGLVAGVIAVGVGIGGSILLNSSEVKNEVIHDTIGKISMDGAYGDECSVHLCDNEWGKAICVYDAKKKSLELLCKKKDCRHNDENCNACVKGEVYYPFVYQGKLYYFVQEDKTSLYSRGLGETQGEKVLEFENSLLEDTIVVNENNIYLAESSTNDEGEIDCELYRIDLKSKENVKLTNYGFKPDASIDNVIMSGNQVVFRRSWKNLSLKDSQLKTEENYEKWLEKSNNPYAEMQKYFDSHYQYSQVDLKSHCVKTIDVNYQIQYDEMENVKIFDDYEMIYCDAEKCYYRTNYGAGMELFEHSFKNGKTRKLDSFYRGTYSVNGKKIYIEKTAFDSTKQIGDINGEDFNKAPEYEIIDVDTGKIKTLDLICPKGKIVLLKYVSPKYIYGQKFDFKEDYSVNMQGDLTSLKNIYENK